MNNKVDKLYALFQEDVVFSANDRINAILGYDVINMGNALSIQDALHSLDNENLYLDTSSDVLYKYTNPLNNTVWLFGGNIIAVKGGGDSLPVIRALYSKESDYAIVTELNFLCSVWNFLNKTKNIRIVPVIGYLSTPHCAILSSTPPKIKKVKLPFFV